MACDASLRTWVQISRVYVSQYHSSTFNHSRRGGRQMQETFQELPFMGQLLWLMGTQTRSCLKQDGRWGGIPEVGLWLPRVCLFLSLSLSLFLPYTNLPMIFSQCFYHHLFLCDLSSFYDFMWHLSFCTWIISFSVILQMSIHIVTNEKIFCFLNLDNFPMCIQNTLLESIHPLVGNPCSYLARVCEAFSYHDILKGDVIRSDNYQARVRNTSPLPSIKFSAFKYGFWNIWFLLKNTVIF